MISRRNLRRNRNSRRNHSRKFIHKKQRKILPPKVHAFFSNIFSHLKKTYSHQFNFVKKNKKFSFILISFFLILLVAVGGVLYQRFIKTENSTVSSSGYSDFSPGQAGATKDSINHLFESDNLQLKIKSYMDNVSELNVENSFLSEKGQFVIIKGSIYNNSDIKKVFLLNKQKISTKKNDYFCSLSATYILADENSTYNFDILPHVKINVSLVFDIPKNERPTELDFYGGINSKPTKIPLG